MPCGCEGHADNEHLCRYPTVIEDLRAYFAPAPPLAERDAYFAWSRSQAAAAQRLWERVQPKK